MESIAETARRIIIEKMENKISELRAQGLHPATVRKQYLKELRISHIVMRRNDYDLYKEVVSCS